MGKEKEKLRRMIRMTLKEMDRSDYFRRSREIQERLYSTDVWLHSKIIGVTLSIFPEVDTYGLIEQAWREGKTIAVPKCIPDTRGMNFFRIQHFNEVEKGYFGLYEPDEGKTERIDKGKIQLLIVPGIVFSRNGYRIGFGGGYYDRYLHGFQGETVSLAFQEQMMDHLPIEKHDKMVEWIVTDKEVIHCLKQ